jgi:hypothetical protein
MRLPHDLGWPALFALCGAAIGISSAGPRARACDCSPPQWDLQLRSVSASAPSVDHTTAWPQQAVLTSYPGHAHIYSAARVDGVISRVGGDQ